MQKKGENLATKEDFDDLLEQVKQTTHATEEIKGQYARIIAKIQVNATVLSGNRQQWINTLRDQLAELISIVGLFAAYSNDPVRVDMKQATEQVARVLFIEAKITLLLNSHESDHASLLAAIHEAGKNLFALNQGRVTHQEIEKLYSVVNKIISIAQGILKMEWNRVKAGE